MNPRVCVKVRKLAGCKFYAIVRLVFPTQGVKTELQGEATDEKKEAAVTSAWEKVQKDRRYSTLLAR